MKKAFTLVEILVSITIVALISGGALLYFNKFASRQKLDKKRDEVISSIKLAQSYAKTRQLPVNSGESELTYVQFQMSGSNLVAGANGIGSTYFSNLINNNGVVVSMPSTMYFWSGEGKLSRDNQGNFLGVGQTLTVYVANVVESGGGNYQIAINALGQIIGVKYGE